MASGILIGFGFIVGGFTSYVASKKGYDGLFWFFLGLFFNLVALIAVAGLPSLLIDYERQKALEKKYKELKKDYETAKENYSTTKEEEMPEGTTLAPQVMNLKKKEAELKKFKKMIETKYS